MGKQIYRFKVF